MKLYQEKRQELIAIGLEACPISERILKFLGVTENETYQGTSGQLWDNYKAFLTGQEIYISKAMMSTQEKRKGLNPICYADMPQPYHQSGCGCIHLEGSENQKKRIWKLWLADDAPDDDAPRNRYEAYLRKVNY